MAMENGKIISSEKLEQARRTARYKKEHCKKNAMICIRITEHQNDLIGRMAAERGLSKSRYILNRAFERPQLSVEAGRIIVGIDETNKELRNQKAAFLKHCHTYGEVDVKLFNELMTGMELLCQKFDRLKEELYKCYLSDIERANYELREKRRADREKQKQAQKVG